MVSWSGRSNVVSIAGKHLAIASLQRTPRNNQVILTALKDETYLL